MLGNSADITALTLYLVILTGIASAANIYSTNLTRLAYKRENRPYLSIDDISFEFAENPPTSPVKILLDIKNHGKLPCAFQASSLSFVIDGRITSHRVEYRDVERTFPQEVTKLDCCRLQLEFGKKVEIVVEFEFDYGIIPNSRGYKLAGKLKGLLNTEDDPVRWSSEKLYSKVS